MGNQHSGNTSNYHYDNESLVDDRMYKVLEDIFSRAGEDEIVHDVIQFYSKWERNQKKKWIASIIYEYVYIVFYCQVITHKNV